LHFNNSRPPRRRRNSGEGEIVFDIALVSSQNETSEASDQHCDFARLATWGESQSSALDRASSTTRCTEFFIKASSCWRDRNVTNIST